MDNSVVIKGNKNGIVVVLDKETSYEELKTLLAQKFADSAKFLGKCKTAISFEGYELTEEQQLEMLDIIRDNTELEVVCVLDKDEEHNEAFKNAIDEKLLDYSGNTARFYKGNLRSGQSLEMETSIIVIGDINPGATVTSNGNILVLGSLRGNAYAGASGNRNAFVFALDMNPMQIRIADTIARAPDNPERNQPKEAKIAFLEDENIYIETVTKSVLNDIKL